MLRLIPAIIVFLALTWPVKAQECRPLTAIGGEIQAAGIPADNIIAKDDVLFVSLYNKALGFTLPDDAEPVGMLIVLLPDRAILHLVENRNGHCVRYRGVIPIALHRKALAAATTGA